MQISIDTPDGMLGLAARIAAYIPAQAFIIFLQGDLGVGKTTLVRGLIQARGHHGGVKSPTYTLVEPYDLPSGRIAHFDLYRIADPQELDFIGLRDYLQDYPLCLFEWPEKARGMLPVADISISICYSGTGRSLQLEAGSLAGEVLLAKLVNY